VRDRPRGVSFRGARRMLAIPGLSDKDLTVKV
jgi:hypothetical protein